MSETPLKRLTPEKVTATRYCRAKQHHAKTSSDVQEVDSEEALARVVGFRYADNEGQQFTFGHLRVGDTICRSCRSEATRASGGVSPQSVPRRSEGLELLASSPHVVEDTARQLNFAAPLSLDRFAEFREPHPWVSLSPAAVTELVQRTNPEIANVLNSVAVSRQREFLSGLGKLIDGPVRQLDGQLVATQRRLEEARSATVVSVSSTIEADLVSFMSAMADEDAFASGSWQRAQAFFSSDKCNNLRELLGRLVNIKGAARNVSGGRQSVEVKLRKVGLVLLQLCRLRTERFSMFALKYSTYLHFRTTPEALVLLELQLGLAVDPQTRRDALCVWRQQHSLDRVREVLRDRPLELAFVGDNVNVYCGVRDFAVSARPRQMNLFAVAYFIRDMPAISMSRKEPLRCELSVGALMLDSAGYVRVKGILTWALHGALVAAGTEEALPPVPDRKHQGSCVKTEWVPITMTAHDSSRPAEVWEMLKDVAENFKLHSTYAWPFYGDMLTCKYVQMASGAFSRDISKPASFDAEIGLFHTQMNTVQKLLFVAYKRELEGAATKLGLHKKLYEPTKNFNSFERTCSGLFVALAKCALKDGGGSLEVLSKSMWDSLQECESTKSAHHYRLLGLLAINCAWKRLVKLADGEAMFDVIRYLLPFLASIKSSMYFRFLAFWVRDTLSMSPYNRTMRLRNLFVNRSGEAGHAREVDLEFEYLVCGVKRMAQSLPNPTKEQLSQVVQDFPLFEQLREEVDAAFKPARHSSSRSVRMNDVAIQQLAAQYEGQFVDPSQMPKNETTITKMPLLFVFEKFHKKLDKITSSTKPTDTVKIAEQNRGAGDELLTPDEHEEAFLHEFID